MIELNKLYNCDCMELMAQIPDKYFELAIVDPPYGIGYDQKAFKSAGKRSKNGAAPKKKYHASNWDSASPDNNYFSELFRVSRNQIIFGANHFISKIPFDSSCWIVWNKDNGNTCFADAELAWTSFASPVRLFKYTWNGMLQENMKAKEYRIHPTQKPVALYEWLLSKFADKGDKILDTHAGSASSLVACHNMGFDFVGCEIDEEYYRLANERLQAAQQQLTLPI